MLYHLVDDAIVEGFSSRQVIITLDILADAFAILSRTAVKKLNLSLAETLSLQSLNL